MTEVLTDIRDTRIGFISIRRIKDEIGIEQNVGRLAGKPLRVRNAVYWDIKDIDRIIEAIKKVI